MPLASGSFGCALTRLGQDEHEQPRALLRACARATAQLYEPDLECEVSMMHPLRALGLAWIVLWAAPTVASAQTTTSSALPPLRLPGIAYPAPVEARTEPPAPALKPQGAPQGAPSTSASPRQVAINPPQPPRAGSLAVVNGRDIPVATVTVVAETETVQHVEPLAPNAQAVLATIRWVNPSLSRQATMDKTRPEPERGRESASPRPQRRFGPTKQQMLKAVTPKLVRLGHAETAGDHAYLLPGSIEEARP